MRFRALEDAVGATGVDAVAHDRPDVLLVPDVLEDRRREPVLQQEPRAVSQSSRRLPTYAPWAGSAVPEISIVDQSTGTP